MKQQLPLTKLIAYACGIMGWSVMNNLIAVLLVYFYLPPEKSGLVNLIPQITIWGAFNLMSLITVSGRLFDALYDPFIAHLSDSSKNPRGRRIPFMKYSVVPATVFCCLVFYPFADHESRGNAVWLSLMLLGFFVSATTYIIPYNALLPELAHSSAEKVKFSTFQQVGFVLGTIISAFVNNLSAVIQQTFHLAQREVAIQYTVIGLSIVAAALMYIPVVFIDEKKYCSGVSTHTKLFPSLKHAFSNRNFRYYIIADFSYFTALNIITSGLLYFLTVLAGLPESEGIKLMTAMVITSLLFYPVVNFLSHKIGKKPIIVASFCFLGLVFSAIYFLGSFPISAKVQIYTLFIMAGLPLASLGILPNAILAEIAWQDAEATGQNREGMYFAVKYLFVKLGQTLGITLFAMLTIYGKDPGNDHGLRLNGLCGFVLCIFAALAFLRFKEIRK